MLACLFAACFAVEANEYRRFEIPRSKVVTLEDTDSGREYDIFIKVPNGYSNPENKDRKYPVVYLTDAMYTFQIVSGATRFPINFGKMEDVFIVGISWENGISPAASRIRDYTPVKDPSWKMSTGEAENHLRFIRTVVFGELDSKYRVDNSRRTYMGNSLGGLLGAYALFQHAEMFKNYVLGSPSFWYMDKMIFDVETAYAERNKKLEARIFVSVGSREEPKYYTGGAGHNLVADAHTFYNVLKLRGYKDLEIQLHIVEGATHQTAFPTTAIQGLFWLFKT